MTSLEELIEVAKLADEDYVKAKAATREGFIAYAKLRQVSYDLYSARARAQQAVGDAEKRRNKLLTFKAAMDAKYEAWNLAHNKYYELLLDNSH